MDHGRETDRFTAPRRCRLAKMLAESDRHLAVAGLPLRLYTSHEIVPPRKRHTPSSLLHTYFASVCSTPDTKSRLPCSPDYSCPFIHQCHHRDFTSTSHAILPMILTIGPTVHMVCLTDSSMGLVCILLILYHLAYTCSYRNRTESGFCTVWTIVIASLNRVNTRIHNYTGSLGLLLAITNGNAQLCHPAMMLPKSQLSGHTTPRGLFVS